MKYEGGLPATTAHECHVDIPTMNGTTVTVRIADIAIAGGREWGSLLVQGISYAIHMDTYNQIRALINKIRPILALEPQETE